MCVLIDDLFQAVRHLHQNQILHRDIKPENILKKNCESVSWALGDFGMAIDLKIEKVEIGADGTKKYLPPEVVQNRLPHSKAADIWSCGATLLNVLKNRCPSEKTWPSQKSAYGYCNTLPGEINVTLKSCLMLNNNRRPSANQILREYGMMRTSRSRSVTLVDESK